MNWHDVVVVNEPWLSPPLVVRAVRTYMSVANILLHFLYQNQNISTKLKTKEIRKDERMKERDMDANL
jgi:hypothetical protein